jgi:hypothetical protein
MSVLTIDRSDIDTVTRAEAVQVTALARAAMRNAVEWAARAAEHIEKAWAIRADQILGYPSWQAYCAQEFAAVREVKWPAPQRIETVAALREAGMSTRAIGSAIGRSDERVRVDLKAANTPLATVTGINGRTYDTKVITARPAAAATPKLAKTEQAVEDLRAAGVAGLTSVELGKRHRRWSCPWAILSDLHKQQRIVRLVETRDGYAVYTVGEHVHGRETEKPGRRSRRAVVAE